MFKFNLSLDDFSPHPKAGLNFECIHWCDKLIEDFPDIKINLFVPAAYCRLGETPHYISKYPQWIKKVNELSENYRINFHGMFHRRHPTDYKAHVKKAVSNNDEWQYLNTKQATELFEMMRDEFERAGIRYDNKIFRPPGWKISKEACDVLKQFDIIVAGDNRHSMSNISYNWDLTGPCHEYGDVFAYGHTSMWTNNYMNGDRYKMIFDFLKNREFNFIFLGE